MGSLNRKTVFKSSFFSCVVSDGGIEVSMVAFQAVDPGSIPGHRRMHIFAIFIFLNDTKTSEPTRDRTWNLLLPISRRP